VGRLRRLIPGLLLGFLLLPCIAAWLDLARGATGRRYEYRAAPRRVIVLGFDGVDPNLLRGYFDRLPALSGLAEEGTFLPCRTTNPPESPVAWATFATGRNPGGHGIFDFVRRDLDAADCYRPRNGMVDKVPPILGRFGFPLRLPRAINRRQGEPFWTPIARAGYRVSILRMPLTFPARMERGGELLCGLGVPDLRATNGSYTLFAAGPDANEGGTIFGGRHVKIYPKRGQATARLEGPPDPRRLGTGRRLTVPIEFRFPGGTATATVAGEDAVALETGLFSRWVRVVFRAGPLVRLEGMVRFMLLRTEPHPAVYVSPIQIAPGRPPVPISSPGDFAADLAERLGPMKTSGWPEDTFAANDRVLDDVAIFRDIRDSYRANERVLFDRLDHSDAALVAMVFTATDRMSHMFYRYRDREHPAHNPDEIREFLTRTDVADPILESYRWMDDTVAKVRATMGRDDILIIVSDHGFHTWRWGVNLNTWLHDNGYLTLHDSAAPRGTRTLGQFFGRGVATGEIDWSRTKAYALGLGQIYINRAGREGEGIVPDSEYRALCEELAKKLGSLRGPDGNAAFTEIEFGDRIWHGPQMRDAPDLQCAFANGYRVSWQTALLGVPHRVFVPNKFPWSGDHCSNSARETSGVFLSNRRLPADASPGLEDIAPTVCKMFEVDPPEGSEGRALPLE
jgi:predicted AlkP superfamily phosphohydrolase/phosphomutase